MTVIVTVTWISVEIVTASVSVQVAVGALARGLVKKVGSGDRVQTLVFAARVAGRVRGRRPPRVWQAGRVGEVVTVSACLGELVVGAVNLWLCLRAWLHENNVGSVSK